MSSTNYLLITKASARAHTLCPALINWSSSSQRSTFRRVLTSHKANQSERRRVLVTRRCYSDGAAPLLLRDLHRLPPPQARRCKAPNPNFIFPSPLHRPIPSLHLLLFLLPPPLPLATLFSAPPHPTGSFSPLFNPNPESLVDLLVRDRTGDLADPGDGPWDQLGGGGDVLVVGSGAAEEREGGHQGAP